MGFENNITVSLVDVSLSTEIELKVSSIFSREKEARLKNEDKIKGVESGGMQTKNKIYGSAIQKYNLN